jgi:uncharacterized membrane protein
MKISFPRQLACVLALFVAGCGGGGSSGTEPSPQGAGPNPPANVPVVPTSPVDLFPVGLATATITGVLDDVLPRVGTIPNGDNTNDSTPTLQGRLDANLGAGQSVMILRDGLAIGQASVSGTEWTFTDRLSAEGDYSYVAVVSDAGGRNGSPSEGFRLRFRHARYTLSLIPLLPNLYWTTPTFISPAGDVLVVFGYRSYSTCHLFSSNGLDEVASPERFCGVNAINRNGQMVGTVDGGYPGSRRASIWNSPTDRADIPVFFGHDYSEAFDISDSGVVAGTATAIGVGSNAFIWSAATGSRLLGALPGDSGSRAVAINSRHVVAGASVSADGSVRAIRWTADTGMQGLDGFPPGTHSEAASINDRGDIAGVARFPDSALARAFIWRSSGLERLPPSPGTDQCSVESIDASGLVYGSCSESRPSRFPSYARAVVWINSEAVDLNQRLDNGDPLKAFAIIDSAAGVDAAGRIAVRVWLQGSTPVSHAALLTPIAD